MRLQSIWIGPIVAVLGIAGAAAAEQTMQGEVVDPARYLKDGGRGSAVKIGRAHV